MTRARVAVVVPTWNGGEHLRPCLEALLDGAPPRGGVEVLLVDNGGRDGSASEAARRFPAIRLERLERNRGFTGGIAHGVSRSDADVVVFVNDDAVVEPETVRNLVETLDHAPAEAIAAAGLLTDVSGTLVDFVDGVVAFDGHALQRGAGSALATARVGREGDLRLFPCGALAAVKRRDFEALGGLDPDYFAYLEDVDFGWRAALAGRTTVFAPSARARHRSGATSIAFGLASRGVLIESNAFFTAYKNLGDEALRALLPAIFATFESRTMTAFRERQADAAESLRDPFADAAPPRPRTPEPSTGRNRVARLVARLAGLEAGFPVARDAEPGAPVAVADEVVRMWLVARSRIVGAWERLARKRAAVQAFRRVPDEAVFERFPLHLIPTYPGDADFFASSFFRSLRPPAPRLVETTLEDVARG